MTIRLRAKDGSIQTFPAGTSEPAVRMAMLAYDNKESWGGMAGQVASATGQKTESEEELSDSVGGFAANYPRQSSPHLTTATRPTRPSLIPPLIDPIFSEQSNGLMSMSLRSDHVANRKPADRSVERAKLPAAGYESMNRGAAAARSGSASPASRRPDPAKTEVFRRGADGKLHPVPGWHTTGPFDLDSWSRNIDWGGVARDLSGIAAGAATFLEGGAFAQSIIDGLGYKIGPDVVRGIVQGHHPWPKFMGGSARQDLARLHASIHRMFHDDLAKAFAQAKFPRIGGRGGGGQDWADYFIRNPVKKDEAIEILRRVTSDFDRRNGTKIQRHLDDTLAKGNPRAPTPY